MFALHAQPFYCVGNLHPLVLYSLAYLMGIWWQTTHELLFLIGIACLSSIVMVYRQLNQRTLFIPTLLLGFFALGSVRIEQIYASITQLFQLHAHRPYMVTGLITETRRYEHPFFSQQYIVALKTGTELQNNKKQHGFHGLYAVLHTPAGAPYMVGDEITIPRLIMMKSDGKDSHDFVARTGIIATIFDSTDRCAIKHHPAWSVARFLHTTRDSMHRVLMKTLSPTSKILFSTIFLGERAQWRTHPNLTALFGIWGLNHHLARSGLHVVLLLFLWLLFLSLLPLNTHLKQITICLLVLIYYVLSWPSLSFHRALYALFIHQMGKFLCTSFDSLHTVATSALLFALINPAYAVSLDFQLTFGLTYALAWLNYAQKKDRQRLVHKNVASA